MPAVNYTLRAKGGDALFDQSPPEGHEAALDQGVVCPAFDLALKKMKKGEKVALTIAPSCKPAPVQAELPAA